MKLKVSLVWPELIFSHRTFSISVHASDTCPVTKKQSDHSECSFLFIYLVVMYFLIWPSARKIISFNKQISISISISIINFARIAASTYSLVGLHAGLTSKLLICMKLQQTKCNNNTTTSNKYKTTNKITT